MHSCRIQLVPLACLKRKKQLLSARWTRALLQLWSFSVKFLWKDSFKLQRQADSSLFDVSAGEVLDEVQLTRDGALVLSVYVKFYKLCFR